ncbi:class I SAM-dependent methyltransferase [Celerinatantimonas sp. YJH-8]|uniref:class I SAM-dependent methyltransferase n=1 Tax=Celerinatantimonas sp. YJH-8 TaxID=3228714 RepID=UPI0038CA5545
MLKPRLLNHPWFSPRREIARTLVVRFLSSIQGAQLILKQPEMTDEVMGDKQSSLQIHIEIRDPCVFERMIGGGSIAAAETYIEGLWRTDALHALLTVLAHNQSKLDRLDAGISWISDFTTALRHRLRQNRKSTIKRTLLAHYNLNHLFYASFLDPYMQFSSALYTDLATENPEASLEQAQLQKLERICQQLKLSKQDHLLEIGSGWGGLAIYAAQHYGCQVTTTTTSDLQYQHCCEQVHKLGLGQQIQVLSRDYRDLYGKFDKVVSVEMLETVGENNLPQFIRLCSERLKSGGIMVLQTVTISDHRYDSYRKSTDFIQQLIFPGTFLPAESPLKAMFVKNHLKIVDELDMRLNYALTLQAWHRRLTGFREQNPQKTGFNSQFFRLWHFYMAYCEAGFISGNTHAWQFTLEHKPNGKPRNHRGH